MSNAPGADTASDGVAGYWRVVIVLMIIYMYAFVDRMMLALLVEPIRKAIHASDLQISLLLGVAFAATYCAFNIPSGYLADRFDRRKMLTIAAILWASMTVLSGSAETYTQIFLARAGIGLAESVVSPTAFSLIRDAVPSRSRALAFSIYGMAPMLGGAISLVSGGVLLRAASSRAFATIPYLSGLAPWQCVLTIVGILGLPIGFLMLTVCEPPRLSGRNDNPESLFGGLVSASRYIHANFRIYGPLLTFSAFGAMMSFAQSAWLPAAFGRHWNLAASDVGPRLGVMQLIGGLTGLLVGGWIMNGAIRRGGSALSYGIVGVIGTAFGLSIAFAAPTLILAYVGAQIAMFFVGVSFSAAATTLGEVTPIAMMGRISALYLVVQTLIGQSVGPVVVASVSQALFRGPSDLPTALSTSMIGFAAVATVAALFLIKNRKQDVGENGLRSAVPESAGA